LAALRHDVGRAELAGELLPRIVATHGDDPLGSHLLRGHDREQADRAIPNDCKRLSGLDVRRIRRRRRGDRRAEREALARAAPTTAMTHIAIQESLDGKNVEWMEKVTDKQYRPTRG
jgi:hypothetical protein